jgi:hypothetical protein
MLPRSLPRLYAARDFEPDRNVLGSRSARERPERLESRFARHWSAACLPLAAPVLPIYFRFT